MTAPLTPAHSPFGGSVAGRVLQCPASVLLVQKVPSYLRRVSAFATRGTALHAVMNRLIENTCVLEADLAGTKIGDYVITADDVENFLRPVLACVDALLDGPEATYYLETRVAFPTVPDTFGTVDLLVRVGSCVYVFDFKFGTGVRVLAVRADGDEDVINAQLMFYAAAAKNSMPEFFAGVDEIELVILQPVSIEPDAEMVSSVTVTPAELDAFVPIYREACTEALAPAPRLQAGAHCRFCPARPICPEHTKPLLDLAQFTTPTPLAATKDSYLQVLADGLNLVDAIKDIRTALHDQAKTALEHGDQVPGYALSAGRAERRWQNEDAAIGALVRLGLTRGDVIVETVRSPRQVELRARARGLKVPAELIILRRSRVALTRRENVHVPVPGRSEIARSFSAALKAFQEGGSHD